MGGGGGAFDSISNTTQSTQHWPSIFYRSMLIGSTNLIVPILWIFMLFDILCYFPFAFSTPVNSVIYFFRTCSTSENGRPYLAHFSEDTYRQTSWLPFDVITLYRVRCSGGTITRITLHFSARNWVFFSSLTILFNKWLIDNAGFREWILRHYYYQGCIVDVLDLGYRECISRGSRFFPG